MQDRHNHTVVLGGIIAVSVILRAASALYQGNVVETLPGIHDQVSYDALARRVLAGYGFSFDSNWWPATSAGEPTAHWSFLYTLYLAGVYALFGPSPLAARMIQAVVVGVLGPWLAYRVGSRVFGQRVALVASGLTASYAYFAYYGGSLVTEGFYLLGILWVFDLALGIGGFRVAGSADRTQGIDAVPGSRRSWLLLGLALGTTVLLRQLFLLIVPVLFAWLLWGARNASPTGLEVGGRSWRSTVVGLLITSAVLAALILPWTARNYLVFDRFVLLNTNAGYVFFWGNHPVHGSDFISILPSQQYGDLIPGELRHLDEAALDQALLGEGIRFVLEDPARYVQLSLSRVGDYFMFWPTPGSGLVSNLARVLSFGLMLPFMVTGLWLAVFRPSGAVKGQRAAVVLLILFIAVYSLVHLLSWTLVRYRLPVDAVLVIFAALAVQRLAASLPSPGMRSVVEGSGSPRTEHAAPSIGVTRSVLSPEVDDRPSTRRDWIG